MQPKSDNLFHFTKSIEILKSIMKYGIQPKYCLEDFQWFGDVDVNFLAIPISCFCDIPLSRISEHTEFYGQYGIGLKKEWGLKNNLNPVIYCSENSNVTEITKYLYEQIYKLQSHERDKGHEMLFKLMSLVKPIKGKMLIREKTVNKEFYQENEWRYIPNVNVDDQAINIDDYKKEKDDGNEMLKSHSLKITPKDICYIFVKCDNDIPQIIDFINTEMDNFSSRDLKILQSRIVSIETLLNDL